MDNVDVIAKNLLENKTCSSCKLFDISIGKCRKYSSVPVNIEDDIEVFVDGLLTEQNETYVITNNQIHMIQAWMDQTILQNPVSGYNPQVSNMNPSRVVIKIRSIKDSKIIKKSIKLNNMNDVPKEETCIGYLRNTDMVMPPL